eukprot:1152622-Pelagomonas_calceolata.AAC.6
MVRANSCFEVMPARVRVTPNERAGVRVKKEALMTCACGAAWQACEEGVQRRSGKKGKKESLKKEVQRRAEPRMNPQGKLRAISSRSLRAAPNTQKEECTALSSRTD